MKKYFTFLSIACLCFACRSNPNPTGQAIYIEPQEGPIKLSQVADSIGYLTLEETEHSRLGALSHVRYSNGHYYIHDGQQSHYFVFDSVGRYVSKIAKVGRGPGEYAGNLLFDVHPQNGQVVLFDQLKQKMLLYSPEGVFLEEVPMGEIVRDFRLLPNGDYLFYTPDHNEGYLKGLWTTGRDGQIKKHWLNNPQDTLNTGMLQRYFYNLNDQIHFMDPYDAVVYRISPNTLETIYRFNLSQSSRAPDEERSPLVANFMETEDWIRVITLPNDRFEKTNVVFYHKPSTLVVAGEQIDNDLDDQPLGIPLAQGIGRNTLLLASPPDTSQGAVNTNPRIQKIYLKNEK
jgi:hypothetical protein